MGYKTLKFRTKQELLDVADRIEIARYNDGRINRIDCFRNNKKIHETQALYSTFAGLKRLTAVHGLLFDEVWNSTETPELQWFDRNPTPIFRYDANLYGTHAITERWTYTVPAGRKFFAEFIQIIVLAQTASAGSLAECDINYQPSGGVDNALFGAILQMDVIGNKSIETGQNILCFEGDVIRALTSNDSLVGVDFFVSLKGTEFDA